MTNQKDKIYHFLKKHPEGVTNKDLAIQCCLRYGARIWELEKEGHTIEKKRLSQRGLFLYRLVEEAQMRFEEVDADVSAR